YEKSNPTKLPGPGGILDLTQTTFTQNKENTVIVKGSRFVPTEDDNYFIKLEGVRKVGYRTVSIAATCDPIMMSKIEEIIEAVKEKVKSNFEGQNLGRFFLDFKLYGKNGATGIFKGQDCQVGSELGIVIEAVGQTQEIANTICSFARSTLLHYGYDGRISTAGNLAFPFSPSDFKAGEVYEFSIYNLMESKDPCKYFPMTIKTFNKGELE
ncbi:MAG: 3-methylaspartate ammonia-lyase, partial [Clostridioides sp.]|nr:3-methylaspartate ammonia-lyase [Clostridioides sp.]